jgi:hypothetical protein
MNTSEIIVSAEEISVEASPDYLGNTDPFWAKAQPEMLALLEQYGSWRETDEGPKFAPRFASYFDKEQGGTVRMDMDAIVQRFAMQEGCDKDAAQEFITQDLASRFATRDRDYAKLQHVGAVVFDLNAKGREVNTYRDMHDEGIDTMHVFRIPPTSPSRHEKERRVWGWWFSGSTAKRVTNKVTGERRISAYDPQAWFGVVRFWPNADAARADMDELRRAVEHLGAPRTGDAEDPLDEIARNIETTDARLRQMAAMRQRTGY